MPKAKHAPIAVVPQDIPTTGGAMDALLAAMHPHAALREEADALAARVREHVAPAQAAIQEARETYSRHRLTVTTVRAWLDNLPALQGRALASRNDAQCRRFNRLPDLIGALRLVDQAAAELQGVEAGCAGFLPLLQRGDRHAARTTANTMVARLQTMRDIPYTITTTCAALVDIQEATERWAASLPKAPARESTMLPRERPPEEGPSGTHYDPFTM